MPHFWTLDGRTTDPGTIIQHDLSKWSHRNQVLAVENLSPIALFAGVKPTEALFHLRPRPLGRLFRPTDDWFLQIFRHSIWDGIRVWLAEIHEFLTEVRNAPPGLAARIPGQPSARLDSTLLDEEAR